MKCPQCGKRLTSGKRRCSCGYKLPPEKEYFRIRRRIGSAIRWGLFQVVFGVYAVSYSANRDYPEYLTGIALLIASFGVFNIGYGIVNMIRLGKMDKEV